MLTLSPSSSHQAGQPVMDHRDMFIVLVSGGWIVAFFQDVTVVHHITFQCTWTVWNHIVRISSISRDFWWGSLYLLCLCGWIWTPRDFTECSVHNCSAIEFWNPVWAASLRRAAASAGLSSNIRCIIFIFEDISIFGVVNSSSCFNNVLSCACSFYKYHYRFC